MTGSGGSDRPELSPEARAIQSTGADLINSLTDLDVSVPEPTAPAPRHRWRAGPRGMAALVMILVIVLAAFGYAMWTVFSQLDDPDVASNPLSLVLLEPDAGAPAAPAKPAVPAPAPQPIPTTATQAATPDTWRFRGRYGLDVTMTLLPEEEGFGRVTIKGEPDAKGGYTWNGSTLKVSYRQPVTLLNGNVEQAKGRFTCAGEPTSARLRCRIRALAWASTSTSQSSQWVNLTATGRPVQ